MRVHPATQHTASKGSHHGRFSHLVESSHLFDDWGHCALHGGSVCLLQSSLDERGKTVGELSMDKDYKAYNIHATAAYVPEGWKPHLYIVYSEGGRNILKNFTIDRRLRPQRRRNKRVCHLRKNG